MIRTRQEDVDAAMRKLEELQKGVSDGTNQL